MHLGILGIALRHEPIEQVAGDGHPQVGVAIMKLNGDAQLPIAFRRRQGQIAAIVGQPSRIGDQVAASNCSKCPSNCAGFTAQGRVTHQLLLQGPDRPGGNEFALHGRCRRIIQSPQYLQRPRTRHGLLSRIGSGNPTPQRRQIENISPTLAARAALPSSASISATHNRSTCGSNAGNGDSAGPAASIAHLFPHVEPPDEGVFGTRQLLNDRPVLDRSSQAGCLCGRPFQALQRRGRLWRSLRHFRTEFPDRPQGILGPTAGRFVRRQLLELRDQGLRLRPVEYFPGPEAALAAARALVAAAAGAARTRQRMRRNRLRRFRGLARAILHADVARGILLIGAPQLSHFFLDHAR